MVIKVHITFGPCRTINHAEPFYYQKAACARVPDPGLHPLQEATLQCLAVGAVIGVLVLVLVILLAYQRYVAGKKPVQHLCDYCGHMVAAVSDCHHAPVRERFLHGVCMECRKECRLVCARCKNPL